MSLDGTQLRHVQYQARFRVRVCLSQDESVTSLEDVCLVMLEGYLICW